MKGDRLARLLAASALGVALLALVLAAWALVVGQQYRDDVRTLGESLSAALRTSAAQGRRPIPLERPPPQIDPDER